MNIKRPDFAAIAKETVAICDAGHYTSPGGKRVELADAIRHATDGTELYTLDNLPKPEGQLGSSSQSIPPAMTRAGTSQRDVPTFPDRETQIEVTGETTFQALARLNTDPKRHLGCLNYASAHKPGGGFLNGAQAQEEALARASALYPCLLRQPLHYERNHANRSSLYLDLIIYSPGVPFFRDDKGQLLEAPVLASVITAAAPNAGAVAQNEPNRLPELEPTLRRRSKMVLDIASGHGVTHLVLGAWGCGVFRNDPSLVAQIFADLLGNEFKNRFAQVVFAVYDNTPSKNSYRAFEEVFDHA